MTVALPCRCTSGRPAIPSLRAGTGMAGPSLGSSAWGHVGIRCGMHSRPGPPCTRSAGTCVLLHSDPSSPCFRISSTAATYPWEAQGLSRDRRSKPCPLSFWLVLPGMRRCIRWSWTCSPIYCAGPWPTDSPSRWNRGSSRCTPRCSLCCSSVSMLQTCGYSMTRILSMLVREILLQKSLSVIRRHITICSVLRRCVHGCVRFLWQVSRKNLTNRKSRTL